MRGLKAKGPKPMESVGDEEVRRFLTHLAVERRVGAPQKQALNAVVFFLREVERKEPGDCRDFTRARSRTRVAVVLTRSECERLFDAMEEPRFLDQICQRDHTYIGQAYQCGGMISN